VSEIASPPASKSARTRAAILSAARDLFGARGYDRTTVREVAAAADCDPALVVRYFGGKERLFAEATELDLRLPDLSSVPEAGIGVTLARHFLDLWEGPNGPALRILLANAVIDPAVAERLRSAFAGQVMPALRRAPPREDAPLRAALVSSQLLGIALCRYLLRLPPLAAAERSALIAAIGPTLQAYVCGPFAAD
jgi:AcrR family transcriptional regulator